MDNGTACNLCFAATSDFLPKAVVTALSVRDHLPAGRQLNVYFLYADIVKQISDSERNNLFEYAEPTFTKYDISIEYHDVCRFMPLFDGQNIGMWGKNISLTHYMYLLSPIVLKHVDRIIYLDTDMIVNTDLSDVFDLDFKDFLLAMGAPRGFEEMGDDVSNAGFVCFNLEQWRKEHTLEQLLEFGKTLPAKNFCDQYLLHEYFAKKHADRLMLLDREYNIFPQTMPSLPLDQIKILHFTGYGHIKPWNDEEGRQRGGALFWHYARKTQFYEFFLLQNISRLRAFSAYTLQQREDMLEKLLAKMQKNMTDTFSHKIDALLTRYTQTIAELNREITSLQKRVEMLENTSNK